MTVSCRFCAEEIDEAAVRCKHCGEFLEERDVTSKPTSLLKVLLALLVGAVGVCLVFSIVGAIAIPGLIPARKQGNEAAAIGALKTIAISETLFREGDKDGDEHLDYGDLADLSDAKLIDQVLGSGIKQGYVFEVQPSTASPETLWFATAEPAAPGTSGGRYFAVNQEGAVFYSTSAPIPMNTDDCSLPADRVASGDIQRVR